MISVRLDDPGVDLFWLCRHDDAAYRSPADIPDGSLIDGFWLLVYEVDLSLFGATRGRCVTNRTFMFDNPEECR